MATMTGLPASLLPVLGVSTKGLACDDPIAGLIQAEFVDRVQDPRTVMLFLPPDLLTASDEDRVATVQMSSGRQVAASLLLSLITQRSDWIPRLQAGLRHRQVRLEDLADKIDHLRRQVPMEIELADEDDTEMEVDAEPFTTSAVPSAAAVTMLGGRQPGELNQQELRTYQNVVIADITKHFFTGIARSVADARELNYLNVKILTECYERIASVVTSQYAVGCLEMRLSFATSPDLCEFRRLADSEALHETIARAVLTSERREWLQTQAKSYGLKWHHIGLRVTVRSDALVHCETYLKVTEEKAEPKCPAEALLRRTAAKEGHARDTPSEDRIERLPKLLFAFVDWLLEEHPHLAERVATVFVASPLDIGLTETMATCRQFFELSSQHEEDLAEVTLEMLRNIGTQEQEPEPLQGTATGGKPVSPLPSSKLVVEALPQSPLAERVERLVRAKLMIPLELADEKKSYGFSSPFVADFALTCSTHSKSWVPPSGFIYEALQYGSSFAILHLLDLALILSLPSEQFSSGVRADEHFGRLSKLSSLPRETITTTGLPQVLSNRHHPIAVVEMYMAFFRYLPRQIIAPLFNRSWVTFGQEWKRIARELLASDEPNALPDIMLVPVSNEEKSTLKDMVEQVQSASHTIDLSGKLANLGVNPFRVVLGCVQLFNVAACNLVYFNGFAALRALPSFRGGSAGSQTAVGQPALKLCKNILQGKHVECILDAMPGLESLSHLDLTGCTVSPDDLQRILNSLPMKSMKMLILSEITFSGSRGSVLPKFSHLKRLQGLDLSFLGLRDEQMPELVQQLSALPDLHELTLEQNPITTAGLSELTPAVASRGSLRVLRLPRCQLDAGAAFVLGAMLTSSRNLHVLNLSNCSLQDSGLQHLSLVIKNHTQLTKVSLRSGQYSPQGLASFLTHLTRCGRMQHLEIGQCPIEADGYDVSDKLIKALEVSRLWDFLGLWQCRLGHTGFLQKMLSLDTQLRGLTNLVLQDNHLGDDSMEHLKEAAKRGVFRYLRHLNLRQNNIRAAGAELMAEALMYLPRLRELLLQHSVIPPSAAVNLSRASLRLSDMTLLEICDSYAMDYQQIDDVMVEIVRIVAEEQVAVGEGVRFAENDQLLENRFVEENLGLLGSTDTSPTGKPLAQSTGGDAEPTIPRYRQLAEPEAEGSKLIIDGKLILSFGHT